MQCFHRPLSKAGKQKAKEKAAAAGKTRTDKPAGPSRGPISLKRQSQLSDWAAPSGAQASQTPRQQDLSGVLHLGGTAWSPAEGLTQADGVAETANRLDDSANAKLQDGAQRASLGTTEVTAQNCLMHSLAVA